MCSGLTGKQNNTTVKRFNLKHQSDCRSLYIITHDQTWESSNHDQIQKCGGIKFRWGRPTSSLRSCRCNNAEHPPVIAKLHLKYPSLFFIVIGAYVDGAGGWGSTSTASPCRLQHPVWRASDTKQCRNLDGFLQCCTRGRPTFPHDPHDTRTPLTTTSDLSCLSKKKWSVADLKVGAVIPEKSHTDESDNINHSHECYFSPGVYKNTTGNTSQVWSAGCPCFTW